MKAYTLLRTGLFLIALVVFNTAFATQIAPNKTADNTVSLNGNWKFKFIPSSEIGDDKKFYSPEADVSGWANIKVPGHWELQGFAEPKYGKVYNDGTGLYKREFQAPAGWRGNPVYITFDGVLFGYTFWINGKLAGEFTSSFNRKTFDISKLVKAGEKNDIAVKVIKQPKGWEFDIFDCWSISGIFRDVTLFSLPATHINDLVVKTSVGKTNAALSVSAVIEGKSSVNASVSASLIDPQGKIVKTFTLQKGKIGMNSQIEYLAKQQEIESPLLWTAETPNLYTLSISLKNKNTEIQHYNQKIGIREITWNDGVLKLNGQAIKLRGVDHHDLSPVNGRAVTETEMRQDLKLIQEANINFIRTSHYPPSARLLELCDSLGLYVMDEVPFGWGEDHLNDWSYFDNLKTRAETTIARDKNHPCVIVWSVGNENPLTKMCIEVGKYVHQLDSTRPHCFPQIGSYFRAHQDSIDASVDILTPHYAVPSQLRGYAKKFNRPMIVTEYAHSLGLDFDRLEESWEIMVANPKMAGGAVWHFFDQGILRKSAEKTVPGTFTSSVWLDSVTVYDNSGNQGADGIMYANRVPQVDYWQVRKVYAPVKIMDDTLRAVPDEQTVQLSIMNRYDFSNLSEVSCSWSLYADTLKLETGNCPLNCAPHDTMTLKIRCKLPEKLTATYYHLKLQFSDRKNYTFYEKVIPFASSGAANLIQKMDATVSKPTLKDNSISFGNNSLTLNQQTGMISLTNAEGKKLILDGPYARMSRKPTMSELATTGGTAEDLTKPKKQTPTGDPLLDEKPKTDKAQIWYPHLLKNPVVKTELISAKKMIVNYTYERQNGKGQFITGTVVYSVSDSGRIDVQYRFVPIQAKGVALEAGISFLLPANLTEFRWVGKGPYPSYPGKDRLDEFGIYHLNSADLNFQGNHEDVDIAVVTDLSGSGLAIVAPKSNIGIEHTAEGLIISHNALVSGRFNKGNMPEKKINIEKLTEIKGTFTIVPLSEKWPLVLKNLFGDPSKTVVPFKPFYNSYDQ